jgi:hypothetical protein
MKIDL